MINQTTKVLFLLFLIINFFSFGQQEVKFSLNWLDEPETVATPYREIQIPNLENSHVTEKEFLYIQELKRSNNNVNFQLLNFDSEIVDQLTKNHLHSFDFNIPETPRFTLKNNTKAGHPVSIFSLFPFVKINGEIRKITSISFRQTTFTRDFSKSMNFASSSVLKEGSGEWYKISVSKDGIYKIDYDFLKGIGVNVDNINPKSINIYGNSFGRLPEKNNIYRPDDLLKNAIYIHGEDDGVFNKGDYILFYAKGPHKWELNNNTEKFERILNNYAEHSVYFINVNSNEPSLRIENAVLSNQSPTHIVTDFNSYSIHEKNLVNILRTGQRWYGEKFDAHLSQSFSFNISNLNTNAPAHVRGAFASELGNSDSNTFVRFLYKNSEIAKGTLLAAGDGSIKRSEFKSGAGVFNPTSSSFNIDVNFTRANPADVGYLDYIEINARSYLKYFNGIQFRDVNSIGAGNVAEFQVSSFPSNGIVWETTNPTTPKVVNGNLSGDLYTFIVNTDSLRSFISFSGNTFDRPQFIEKVSHQNLHGLAPADYLIVTHPSFLSHANRLANLHRANGLTVHVVTTQQVYNEFSSGTQDPTAIKFFAKMFFDRAEGDASKQPKYLLLFGKGSYDPLDRVENNINHVVMYETEDSESYTSSVVSDDYFGLLDDSESFEGSDLLDIAVGRLMVSFQEDATVLVDKIEHYMKKGADISGKSKDCCGDEQVGSTEGDWRNRYMVIADDEQGGSFVTQDLEPATNYVLNNHPEMNVKKVYSDAHVQITTAGGERYPTVNEEISRTIESGVILSCFVGHGGPTGAASERIITVGETQAYTNYDKLTLFISATCEFARVDDNERVSIGEYMSLNKNGGAIALMTTSRAVWITVNTEVTNAFFKEVFKRDAEMKPRTFGDIMLDTKNDILSGSTNKRSFMLLGDPALRIALPYQKIILDSLNNVDVNLVNDTIRALSPVRMSGHIEDQYGNHLNSYNGIIQPTIYDKPNDRATLGQDEASPVIEFQTQESILFRGKASVKNGKFDFEFIVPKDISYSYGNGKASFYSWSETENAGGYSHEFMIGGIDTLGINDDQGPEIELYLNDENFVNGGMTNEIPILIAKLHDESGINTIGNGIGHDITVILDDKTSEAIVLNDFYESDLDTYKSGEVRYQLNKLSKGLHTLTFKAWDVNNNSSERRIEFNVQEEQELKLDHVLNYPNPFTTHTEFFFEHNQICAALETQIEIFTVTGRLVKTINQLVETRGFRTAGIVWDGRDEFGDELARGVYIYRVTVVNPDGEKVQEIQKLYLLK